MDRPDFYSDEKYCERCRGYVPYLQSLSESYCSRCGGQVRLFSNQDWERFQDSLKERRPRGGRPRKDKSA